MDLQDLRIFARVAALQNLSAVGVELGLTPGTISKRLQSLEDDLRVRLFDRTTRSIRITAEGKTFLEHVERILLDVETARASIGDYVVNPRGKLRVRSPLCLGRYEVGPAISAFLQRFPEIELQVDFGDRIISMVDEGYDLLLRIGEMTDSSFIAKRLGRIEHLIVAAPTYLEAHGTPAEPDDLARHNCLLQGDRSTWSFTTRQRRDEQRYNVRVNGRLRSNSATLLHWAALDGHGILSCSSVWVREDIAKGRLKVILPKYAVAEGDVVYAIHAANKHISPRLRALLDFLADWFHERERTFEPIALKGRAPATRRMSVNCGGA